MELCPYGLSPSKMGKNVKNGVLMSTCESDLETSACLIVIVAYVAVGQLMRPFYVDIDFRLRKLTCMCVEKTHVCSSKIVSLD